MTLRRAPVVDEYAENDECVVMLTDGRVLALSPLATAVLSSIDQGATEVAALAETLTARFGSPHGDPDGIHTTSEVLRSLSEAGLLLGASA